MHMYINICIAGNKEKKMKGFAWVYEYKRHIASFHSVNGITITYYNLLRHALSFLLRDVSASCPRCKFHKTVPVFFSLFCDIFLFGLFRFDFCKLLIKIWFIRGLTMFMYVWSSELILGIRKINLRLIQNMEYFFKQQVKLKI